MEKHKNLHQYKATLSLRDIFTNKKMKDLYVSMFVRIGSKTTSQIWLLTERSRQQKLEAQRYRRKQYCMNFENRFEKRSLSYEAVTNHKKLRTGDNTSHR